MAENDRRRYSSGRFWDLLDAGGNTKLCGMRVRLFVLLLFGLVLCALLGR